MSKPELSVQLKSNEFQNYYYLKEDLIRFCKENNLPVHSGKIELTKRIAYYLETGEILEPLKRSKPKKIIQDLFEDTLIEPNFVCSQIHREFFRKKLEKVFLFQ